MVHLNELQQKYGEKGLTVVGVSAQGKGAVEAFIEEFGVEYPTVTAKMASIQPFRSGGVPHAHLIDTDGRILWSGHPGELPDAKIEEAIEGTKILPDWPDSLKAVKKAFLKDKYMDALLKLEKAVQKGDLEADDADAAEGIQAWIEWYGKRALEGAVKDQAEGRHYEAAQGFELVADLYKKHPYATEAEAGLKELLSDPDRKKEVKAGAKLAKILVEIADEKPKKALKKLKPMLSKKYAETKAGQRAAEIAKELEAQLD